jgi:sugar transferase (PEP-CTERM/EpsH1 system associated)
VHILWLKTELLHPIDKGGRIRTYQMLRALKRDHRITYLTLDNGKAAPDAAERATEYCHELIRVPMREAERRSPQFWGELLTNVVSSLPYAVAKYRSPAMRREVERVVGAGDVDVLVCDFLFPSQNVPDELGCRTVLFQHNVEAMIWQRHVEVRTNSVARAYFSEQWRRMRRFEAAECRRFNQVIAVSAGDAEALEREYGITGVGSVPTGVDTEYFRPAGRAAQEPRDIVFTGAMDWMPNEDGIRWFAGEVLPLIQQRMPDVTLTVVGRNPPPAIRSLAERDSRVRVTGTVPDVRPYLERAAVVIVPLRVGGGTRLKIYEALAMERPLVSTTIGSEGLPLEDGIHARIADGTAGFADAVLGLLADPAAASIQARTGARYVREHCGWDRAAEAFIRAISATEAVPATTSH